MKIDLPRDRPQLTVDLADGSTALLSPLGPEDKILLVEGLEELSIESRYNRFGYGRAGLTASELEYLSDVDQHDHVAWGVALDGDGAGVGRYVRLDEDDCADIAVTVLDRFQRRGLGRLLFETLVAVARADGIRELCFEFAPGNIAVERMIRGIEVELDESGSALLGRISVEEVPVSRIEEAVLSVMTEARAR